MSKLETILSSFSNYFASSRICLLSSSLLKNPYLIGRMENSTWHPGQSLGNLVAADNAARSSRRSPFQDRFAESLATSHPDQSQLYVFDTVSEASWNAAAEQHPFSSLKDTQQNDHSHKLRLLSLDGGGIRGLSTLQILKTLMESVNNSAPVKPCDYFEMIGGTSTGGLIAIMLGRLHMTVDECMEAYRELSSRVFQKKNTRFNYKGKIQGQFDAHELELAVQNVLKNRGLDENTLLKDANGRCKVFVCTTAEQTGETVCLTTYRSPRMAGSDLSESTTIWQACRATTAATSFFEPIAIGQYGETFVDGAFGANNPIEQLWNEARDVWSNSFPNNVGCVVSIGTGLSRLRPVGDRLDKIWKTLEAMATETDKTAEIFHRDKADLAKGGRYYRFNVDRGLEAIGLEEYKKVREIIAATRNWTREQQNHVRIIACAHQLAS
ncbi:acyl transferase/acyl hydrolase/lysophospholipase [Nemania sp. FL0031]|nr:acyl transferase/acyl hydrolase/lysophospholipase [Nemania sp. FL0031]